MSITNTMRRSTQLALASSLCLVAVLACGNGSTVSGPIERGIPGQGLPGAGGAAPLGTPTSPYFIMPVDPQDGSGLPPAINDPGPGPFDATQCDTSGYEFAIYATFEEGKASKTYSFNDSTSEVFPLVAKDWEPPSTQIPAAWTAGKVPACGPGSAGNTHALHLAGTFSDFGAGLGTVLFNHETDLNTVDKVNVHFDDLSGTIQADGSNSVPVLPPAHPIVHWPTDTSYVPGMKSANLIWSQSAWDGITFWARRSPFAGPGIRAGLLDRTSSDDFNKQLPPDLAVCRSIYTQCSCLNNRPCTHWDPDVGPNPSAAEIAASIEPLTPTGLPPGGGDFCWDPKIDKYPAWDPTLRCGQTACDYHADTPIPAMTYNPVNADEAALWRNNGGINTMTCSPEPYVFKDSTTPSAKYCYRPGVDADPPEKADRCNDSFLGEALLDTHWKRYMIPFADLRQGNIDKHSPGIDLAMVEALVFAFPGGHLDVWIDDVGFYRKKK